MIRNKFYLCPTPHVWNRVNKLLPRPIKGRWEDYGSRTVIRVGNSFGYAHKGVYVGKLSNVEFILLDFKTYYNACKSVQSAT